MTKEQKTLRLTARLITLPFGLLFAAAAWPPLYAIWRPFFMLVHWPFLTAPETLDPTSRLLVAISGGLGAGIGAAVWSIATHVMPVVPETGRKVIRNAALTWFAIYSTFSVVAGAPMNVVPNRVLLAMLLLPLRASKKRQRRLARGGIRL